MVCASIACECHCEGARERNQATLSRLRPDAHESALWDAVQADVKLGRMAPAVAVESLNLDEVLLTPRFGLEQGEKVRPIDDATSSGLNARTRCPDQCRHDTVDALAACASEYVDAEDPQEDDMPGFWKVSCAAVVPAPRTCKSRWQADFDSAFRRVGLHPAALPAAYVTFLRNGVPVAALHFACFFGAVASVHNWERVGALFAALLRHAFA